ncbi:MAG TPA: hypothetical protein VMN56_09195 [Casimicrobiaceae bacterium]|nr:hypothetical protein [Casimicrobiaceae bacterium]
MHSLAVASLAVIAVTAAVQPNAAAKDKGATRAEVQIGLCEPVDTLEHKLAWQPRGPAYDTWLFDDNALSLLERGLRLRLRASSDRPELTLKAAVKDCDDARLAKSEGKCELDVYAGKASATLSLTRALRPPMAQDLAAGRAALAHSLSDAQASYLRDAAHAWPLPPGLRPLGPIDTRTYASGRYEIDVTTLPDGARYAEISIKVPAADMARAQGKLEAFLRDAGVQVCADQQGQAADKLRRLAVQQPK